MDEISRENQIFRINSQTTYYAYGLGVLGEKKEAWSYYLNDGLATTRQMSDATGYIILSRSFTPWGELLELHGEGDFSWGYLGGLLDAATGLIYVGNGQYYDPATGRFLTRGVYPGAPNPYIPWRGDPLGMILGPLALLALVRGKRKAGRIDQFLALGVILLALGATVAGCTFVPPTGTVTLPAPSPTLTPTLPPTQTETPRPTQKVIATATIMVTSTTTPTPTLTAIDVTCPPEPSSTPDLPEGDTIEKAYKMLATTDISKAWWRTKSGQGKEMDDIHIVDILAVIAYLELNTVQFVQGATGAFTSAFARQFWGRCSGGCSITDGRIDSDLKMFLYGFSVFKALATQMNSALIDKTYGEPSDFYDISEQVLSCTDPLWKVYSSDEPLFWGNAIEGEAPDWLVQWIVANQYKGSYNAAWDGVYYAFDNWFILTPRQQNNLCHNERGQTVSCVIKENLEKPDWLTERGF